ncbi:hypothetical protein D7X96_01985 [Corallococcus interemptor]|uniref:Uncharacterized protein n=1 Tax=Corallococcus interemptor TaxID=2316720 RepID=A0A3A8QXH5_9BACT|nr:hypothetical protein [Corallococcus interemptor]RKH47646.1 hypothetical protein D7Y23_21675 [Corallococcus sp. AB050B]RKH73489.1 hypothetical protein D7X96_01985 [Corallococcus interemptor]
MSRGFSSTMTVCTESRRSRPVTDFSRALLRRVMSPDTVRSSGQPPADSSIALSPMATEPTRLRRGKPAVDWSFAFPAMLMALAD